MNKRGKIILVYIVLCVLNYRLKVKLFLFLTKYHALKTYWGVEVKLHVFLTSTLDVDD